MNKPKQNLISAEELKSIKTLYPDALYIAWDSDGKAWLYFGCKPIWRKYTPPYGAWQLPHTVTDDYEARTCPILDNRIQEVHAPHTLFDLTTGNFISNALTENESLLTAEEKKALRIFFPWAKWFTLSIAGEVCIFENKPDIYSNYTFVVESGRVQVLLGFTFQHISEDETNPTMHCESLEK